MSNQTPTCRGQPGPFQDRRSPGETFCGTAPGTVPAASGGLRVSSSAHSTARPPHAHSFLLNFCIHRASPGWLRQNAEHLPKNTPFSATAAHRTRCAHQTTVHFLIHTGKWRVTGWECLQIRSCFNTVHIFYDGSFFKGTQYHSKHLTSLIKLK